jgi:exodeoxyribonuclease VII large subunit
MLTRHGLAQRRQGLQALLKQHGFRRVRDLFQDFLQRVDEMRQRLDEAAQGRIASERERLQRARAAYGLREALPRRLAEARVQLERAARTLESRTVQRLTELRRRMLSLHDRLRALSPREVLQRGYALVKGPDGRFVRSAADLSTGSKVTLEFARGEADATVTTLRTGGDDGTRQDGGR